MRRSEALQGVRVIKFTSILSRCEAAELNQMDAAELLGIDARRFRRWHARHLPLSQMPGTIRRQRPDRRRKTRRLSPLDGEQNQKKRTFGVQPKPDKSIGHRQKGAVEGLPDRQQWISLHIPSSNRLDTPLSGIVFLTAPPSGSEFVSGRTSFTGSDGMISGPLSHTPHACKARCGNRHPVCGH